MGENTVITEND